MARIVGTDIPDNKKVKIALRYIFGIGPKRALDVCTNCGIDPEIRVREMSESDLAQLNSHIQNNLTVEGDLRRQIQQDIRRLITIGSYRGSRHRRSLPVRGQRTKTNARTRKGKKQTVGAIRDRAARRIARAGDE